MATYSYDELTTQREFNEGIVRLEQMSSYLQENMQLYNKKKQLEARIEEINKKIIIVSSTLPEKQKNTISKISNTVEYFNKQIDIKRNKTEEIITSKEKYIKYLEAEKERKMREIMNYYDTQIMKTQEAIDKAVYERDEYIDSCNAKIESNEEKIMGDSNKSPIIQKLETERELISSEVKQIEEQMQNNIKKL
jgi:hypothetical protein